MACVKESLLRLWKMFNSRLSVTSVMCAKTVIGATVIGFCESLFLYSFRKINFGQHESPSTNVNFWAEKIPLRQQDIVDGVPKYHLRF